MSTTAILIRHLTQTYHMPPLVLAFWRDGLVALTLLPVLGLLRPSLLQVERQCLLYLVGYGLVLASFNALDAARQAVESAQRDGIPRLRILASAYQARIWLAQGQHDLAAAWTRNYRHVGETGYLREFEDLALARVSLAEGRPAEALALLAPMLPSAVDAGHMGTVIEIQALCALACHALDKPDAALGAMDQALALAEPEGYLRLFVGMGQPMVALLKGGGSHGIAPQYVSRLLAALAPHEPTRPGLERQPLIEPLTEHELEVLQLLAERLSNREIGRRLFISLPCAGLFSHLPPAGAASPSLAEMLKVKRILEATGLRTVVVQTAIWILGATVRGL